MTDSFIDTLMQHIMEGVMIPKSQIERAVGPILSMFLADVLTETFRRDAALSGKISMVCPEFPLKKSSNWQSTNIDYLLFNEDRKQLIFLELKTSDTSVGAQQCEIYRSKQKEVKARGGAFLIEDLVQIRDRSSEQGKYRYLIEKKILPFKSEITGCSDATVIYLVPKSAEQKVKDQADRVLTYGMLAEAIKGPYAEEWRVIRNYLCQLDDSSKRSRNRSSLKVEKNQTPGKPAYWQDTVKFDEMVRLCHRHGNKIIVGFTGGKAAFSRNALSELKSRRSYKWDYSENTNRKKMADWLAGSAIIEMLKTK